MKVLIASLLLLFLIFGFCVYSGIHVTNACDRILDATAMVQDHKSAAALKELWQKEKGMLSLFVNRSLLTQAENTLARLNESLSDPVLFRNTRAELVCLLQTVQQSYGYSFSSIL